MRVAPATDGRGSPRHAGLPVRVAGMVLLLVAWTAASASGQDTGKNTGKAPTCARALQGYVRLFDAAVVSAKPLRRATVELRTEPHDTLVDRVRTDGRGWFKFPGGLPKKGTPFRLRVSAPGATSVTLKLTLDPGCGAPVIALLPATAVKGGVQ